MLYRAFAVLFLAFSILPAAAQDPSPRSTLAIKGRGEVDIKPDHAAFDVTVSTTGRSLSEAEQGHEGRATRALAFIQGLRGDGIDVSKSSFVLKEDRPLAPVFNQQQAAPAKLTEPKFTAETTFYLKAKAIEALNTVITKLAESGLFSFGRVNFMVEKERAALNQARRAAILDAREQAAVYADAADLRLMDIVEITDGEANPVHGEADLAVPRFVQIIPPATITFYASVNVVWRIAPR